jgi:hypothetical protein
MAIGPGSEKVVVGESISIIGLRPFQNGSDPKFVTDSREDDAEHLASQNGVRCRTHSAELGLTTVEPRCVRWADILKNQQSCGLS